MLACGGVWPGELGLDKGQVNLDRFDGASLGALAAAYALERGGVLGYVDIHLADTGAFATFDALVRIDMVLQERDLVEQRIEGPEGADPFAERSIEHDAQKRNCRQYAELHGEEAAQRGPDARIGKGQRDGALKYALRAYVLAEVRVSHPHGILDEGGKGPDHYDQDAILEVTQAFESPRAELLGKRDFVEQILNPAEGTEETTYEPSQKRSYEDQNPSYIVGETELGGPDNRLERPDWTSPCGRRARIAVKSRDADRLRRTGVNSPLEEIRDVGVGQEGGYCLYGPSPAQERPDTREHRLHRMHLPDAHALEAYPYRLGENGMDLSSVGPVGDKRATEDHQQHRCNPYTTKAQDANRPCLHMLPLLHAD